MADPVLARLAAEPGVRDAQVAAAVALPDGSEDPLDASAVHPEACPVVRRILDAAGTDARGLIGDAALLRALQPRRFVDASFGLPTVLDILREVVKPGDIVRVKVLEVDEVRRRGVGGAEGWTTPRRAP